MGKPVSGTSVQKTYKNEVITLFGRFSGTGAAGVQAIILTDGASKGFASLVAGATAADGYTLLLDDTIKAQVILGSPVISYIKNTTATAGSNLVARTRTETVATSGASGLTFLVQDDAGAAAYFPVDSVITVTLTISTSPVF